MALASTGTEAAPAIGFGTAGGQGLDPAAALLFRVDPADRNAGIEHLLAAALAFRAARSADLPAPPSTSHRRDVEGTATSLRATDQQHLHPSETRGESN